MNTVNCTTSYPTLFILGYKEQSTYVKYSKRLFRSEQQAYKACEREQKKVPHSITIEVLVYGRPVKHTSFTYESREQRKTREYQEKLDKLYGFITIEEPYTCMTDKLKHYNKLTKRVFYAYGTNVLVGRSLGFQPQRDTNYYQYELDKLYGFISVEESYKGTGVKTKHLNTSTKQFFYAYPRDVLAGRSLGKRRQKQKEG